jgi:hypothetical protein
VDKRGNELLCTTFRDIASKLHRPKNNIGDFRDRIRRLLKTAEVRDKHLNSKLLPRTGAAHLLGKSMQVYVCCF